jgi:hypothetical protein
MASYDVLKGIVSNGSDLTLTDGISYEVIRELAELARGSGAKLTVTTDISYDLILELSRTYGKSIAFVDGLSNFRKD